MSDAPTFERARRPEHKEQRRAAILMAARTLGLEKGVPNVTLGDIAERSGMAKSNVLRYFGTREEIYLDLCLEAFREWLGALPSAFAEPPVEGPAGVARVVARTLGDRPLLCDLLTQGASTLEHNVRPERGRDFKEAILSETGRLGAMLATVMPALREEQRFEAAALTGLVVGGIWPTCTTPAAILELMDPAILEMLPATFAERMERALHPLYVGLAAI